MTKPRIVFKMNTLGVLALYICMSHTPTHRSTCGFQAVTSTQCT